MAAGARAVRVFGPQAVPNYIISMCQSVSDMLEAAILLKEVGLLDASGTEPYSPVGIVPLFETIDDLQRGFVDSGSGAGPSAVPRPGVRAR